MYVVVPMATARQLLAANGMLTISTGCLTRSNTLLFDRLCSHAGAASRLANPSQAAAHDNASTQCRRRRTVTKAARSTADATLSWVAPENRQEVLRVLELAERAAQSWELTFTEDFLPPPIAADAMAALAGRSDVQAMPWGGYSQAERCRLVFGREEIMQGMTANPHSCGAVAALSVKGNFMFDPAKHPDFLGAILGTGVVRERVGDILVQGESGAQILVHPELVEHFEDMLTQVRTVPVKTKRIELSELQVPLPSVQELNSVEASMRLDAIASAGFRMSRSKMMDLIKAGSVRVNWRPVTRPAMDLKPGDIVSVSGKGRMEVKAASNTKKDKWLVSLVRYT